MNLTPRLFLAPVLLAGLVASATAQDFSTTTVFTFAPALGPDVVSDPNTDLKATPNLKLRPNKSGEFYLYAFNPSKVQKTYVVEMKGSPGSGVAAQVKVAIPGEKWARVRLPKPAPPAAPAPVAVAPVTTPPVPSTPLPPGAELASSSGLFQFTLRLLNADLTPVADANGLNYGQVVTVNVLRPENYIAPPTGSVTRSDRLTRVNVNVSPMLANGQPVFTGTADLRLAFPPQSALSGAIIREGFYRRSLVVEPGTNPTATLVGAVENAGEKVRIDVGVDGLDRAFIYEPAPAGDINVGKLNRILTPAIRLFPAVGYKSSVATQPVPAFPVRVEADNAPPDATVQLWIRPRGASDDPAVNERVPLGGAYEERLWLEVSGPTEGLFLTNQARDWVKSLDLAALRGEQEIVAVLSIPGTAGAKILKSEPLRLIVDATPPEEIKFAKLPARQIKGKPLAVRATVVDPETKIVKAVFFLGKPTDDGKLPADAILVEGKMVKGNSGEWEAALPLLPERRGEAFVGVVMTNEVGLSTTATQRIELVDAPPPLGAIDGIVKAGELPAAGTLVNLFDGDNKMKNTATADSRGRFKMEGIIPGTYTLRASKPTSSYPLGAAEPVQVEAEKRAKALLSMVKQVK